MKNAAKSDIVVWVIAIGINLISTFILWILKKMKLIPLKKSVPIIFIIVTITFLGLSYFYFDFKGLFYAILIYIALVEIGVALYLFTDFKLLIKGVVSIGVKKTYPKMKDSRKIGESEYHIASRVTRSFKFCTISGRSSIFSSDFENLLKEKARDRCEFFFLFFDPESKCFEEKIREEGSDVKNSKGKIQEVTRALCQLKDEFKLNIHVRWYSEYPIWRFIISDDQIAHVGFYPPGKKGYEGPWVIFDNKKESSFFHPFSKYFDLLWKNAKEKC